MGVGGVGNPADVFTKHLESAERIRSLLQLVGCEYRGGRSDRVAGVGGLLTPLIFG